MIHLTKGVVVGSVYGASWLAAAATSIDEHSLVPIGIALGITAATGGLIWKISDWKAKLEARLNYEHEETNNRFEEIQGRFTRIEDLLKHLMTQRRYDNDVMRSEMPATPTKPVKPEDLVGKYSPMVLIVDDDDNDRYITRRNLREAGFRVLEAESMKEANDVMIANRVDCTLLDLDLKGLGTLTEGAETIAAFLRTNPTALCVALTGNEDPKVKAEVLAAGADAFAFKPDTADAGYLPKIVRTAMDRHAMKMK